MLSLDTTRRHLALCGHMDDLEAFALDVATVANELDAIVFTIELDVRGMAGSDTYNGVQRHRDAELLAAVKAAVKALGSERGGWNYKPNWECGA